MIVPGLVLVGVLGGSACASAPFDEEVFAGEPLRGTLDSGGAAAFLHVPAQDGRAFLWASSEELDPALSVEPVGGAPARDELWLVVEAQPGTQPAGGSFTLHVAQARETDVTRARSTPSSSSRASARRATGCAAGARWRSAVWP